MADSDIKKTPSLSDLSLGGSAPALVQAQGQPQDIYKDVASPLSTLHGAVEAGAGALAYPFMSAADGLANLAAGALGATRPNPTANTDAAFSLLDTGVSRVKDANAGQGDAIARSAGWVPQADKPSPRAPVVAPTPPAEAPAPAAQQNPVTAPHMVATSGKQLPTANGTDVTAIAKGRSNADATQLPAPEGGGYVTAPGGGKSIFLPGGQTYTAADGTQTTDWKKTSQYAEGVARNAADQKALSGYFQQHLMSGNIDGAMRAASSPEEKAQLGVLIHNRNQQQAHAAQSEALVSQLKDAKTPQEAAALTAALSAHNAKKPGDLLAALQGAQNQQTDTTGKKLDQQGKALANDRQTQLAELYKQFQSAKTDEEKGQITDAIHTLLGTPDQTKVMELGGGQVFDEKAGVALNLPKGFGVVKNGKPSEIVSADALKKPTAEKLPPGAVKKVGTANGVPVYEDAKGNRFTVGGGKA